MTFSRAALLVLGCLLTLSACGPSNGFTIAKTPCGENVGPDYTSLGTAGQTQTNMSLGDPSQGCS